MSASINPDHYKAYDGIEVIQLTEQLNFCRGNAVKYIARAGLKDPLKEVEDLEKAKWYIERELARLEAKNKKRRAEAKEQVARAVERLKGARKDPANGGYIGGGYASGGYASGAYTFNTSAPTPEDIARLGRALRQADSYSLAVPTSIYTPKKDAPSTA